jgi:NADH-quinone oxidoreductase subunit F
VTNAARCFLASEELIVTASMLAAFPEEFQAHLEGTCALRHLIVPKMTDYVPGEGFVYDRDYTRKQPDWTYAAG